MKRKINPGKSLFLLIILSSFLFACGGKQSGTEAETQQDTASTEDIGSNTVDITAAQYKASRIEVGSLERRPLSGVLKVNGFVEVPPENLFSVTTQMGGIVKSVGVLQGSPVRKGQVIAVLENQDYVQMQQDYLESSSQLELAEAEYQRQLELSRENVNALKTVQQAKAQYQTMRSRTAALRERLKLINIPTATLRSDNIRSSIGIYAPANGYVTKVNINAGKFVAPNDVMMEIVNNINLHVELKVFEKDVSKVKAGQPVRFMLNNETVERAAKVVLVGREVDVDKTVTVHCLATIDSENLIPNTYINAYIETGSNRVPALPESSVVDYLGKPYVFVEKVPGSGTHRFEMVGIMAGTREAGYVEVKLPEGIDSTRIVRTGAYDLLSKMKNSEEEE